MKFTLPDSDGCHQEIVLEDAGKGLVTVHMQSKEDVTSIIESNKRAQKMGRQGMGEGTQESMYKLGELSALQTHELMKQGIFQDDKALRKWFDDLNNYLWRTAAKKRKGGT